jgi:hypothetical protein
LFLQEFPETPFGRGVSRKRAGRVDHRDVGRQDAGRVVDLELDEPPLGGAVEQFRELGYKTVLSLGFEAREILFETLTPLSELGRASLVGIHLRLRGVAPNTGAFDRHHGLRASALEHAKPLFGSIPRRVRLRTLRAAPLERLNELPPFAHTSPEERRDEKPCEPKPDRPPCGSMPGPCRKGVFGAMRRGFEIDVIVVQSGADRDGAFGFLPKAVELARNLVELVLDDLERSAGCRELTQGVRLPSTRFCKRVFETDELAAHGGTFAGSSGAETLERSAGEAGAIIELGRRTQRDGRVGFLRPEQALADECVEQRALSASGLTYDDHAELLSREAAFGVRHGASNRRDDLLREELFVVEQPCERLERRSDLDDERFTLRAVTRCLRRAPGGPRIGIVRRVHPARLAVRAVENDARRSGT